MTKLDQAMLATLREGVPANIAPNTQVCKSPNGLQVLLYETVIATCTPTKLIIHVPKNLAHWSNTTLRRIRALLVLATGSWRVVKHADRLQFIERFQAEPFRQVCAGASTTFARRP